MEISRLFIVAIVDINLARFNYLFLYVSILHAYFYGNDLDIRFLHRQSRDIA